MSKPRSLHYPVADSHRSRAKQMLLALLVGLFAVTTIVSISHAQAAPNDFDKDAKSDLVMTNSAGAIELWLKQWW